MAYSPSPSKEQEVRDAYVAEDGRYPLFDTAIANNSAPFGYLVEVIRGIRKEDEEIRQVSLGYYSDILKAFESKWGTVHYLLVLDSNALVFTQKSHMFHEETALDLASLELIHRCDQLQTEAHRLLQKTEQDGSKLRESDLFCCMDMIVELLSHLYASMDSLKKNDIKQKDHDKLVAYLQKELVILEDNFMQCTQRRARDKYYIGMLTGLGIITVVNVLINFLLYALTVPLGIIATFFGSIISGGMGAIISVMTRMSNKKFPLDYKAGPEQNNRLGIFRPIIGATMGGVLYFLMMSDLLPLDVPVNGSKELFFILSIAFSAGFTERWAQDMLPGIKVDEEKPEKEPSKTVPPPVTVAPPETEEKKDSRETPK